MSLFSFTNVEGVITVAPEYADYDNDTVISIIEEHNLFDNIDNYEDPAEIYISSSRDGHYTSDELLSFYRDLIPYISSAELTYSDEDDDSWKDIYDGSSWSRYTPEITYTFSKKLI